MPLDPSKQARAAAEAIRTLNHTTLKPKQPIPAPMISSTMQALEQLVARLPQALEQLSGHLHNRQLNGAIRMDDDTDPGPAVAQARTELLTAVQALNAATRHLDEASSLLFHMGAPWA